MTAFKEDWQLSQFWYDEATGTALANEAARVMASTPGRVAFVSAPTAFVHMKRLHPDVDSLLLEFDSRFEMYAPDFCLYDYNKPLELENDRASAGSCAVVLLDPPFLSEECFEKTSKTVKHLLAPGGKIIVCTGAGGALYSVWY